MKLNFKNVNKEKLAFGVTAALLIIAVLVPFIIIGVSAFLLPAQYDLSFVGALPDKYERLYSIDEPKVIVVGGSNIAFGLNSELLSEHVGMPVVNFGLYATLGTKVMLDLSEAAIGEGDIVVIAPETNEQTLSLYFNAETVWQAFDGKFSMLKHIKSDNRSDMVGEIFEFASSKLGYAFGEKPDPAGVYNHASFNEYGDIIYARPGNIMKTGYDPTMTVDFSTDMFAEDFIDYVNEYVAKAEKKGAKVFYSFPPINASAVPAEVTEDTLFEYYRFISENLDCPVISNINDYIIEEDYFYDSNFHLNDAGVVLRTANLIADINRELGVTKVVSIEIPPAPPKQNTSNTIVSGDNSTYAEYFLYDEFADGLVITGLNPEKAEEAKGMRNITLPAVYNGKAVLALAAGGLSGCDELRQLTVDKNIVQFYDGAFAGCPSLTKIIMNYTSPDEVAVGDALFEGAADTARLCFSDVTVFNSFEADYYWGVFADRIVLE